MALLASVCPDHEGVARYRHREAELVTGFGVGGFEIGLLAPGRAAAHKHIRRAGSEGTVVRLVAVHAGGAAVLPIRPDHKGVARYRHRRAESVIDCGVGGFEIGLLAPGRAAAHKHIRRAGTIGTVVRPVAVHAGGVAGLQRRPDHHRVARYRHRTTELVTASGVGGFEVGLLCEGRVNGQRIARGAVLHIEGDGAARRAHRGRNALACRVPHFEMLIRQHRALTGIAQFQRLPARRRVRLQIAFNCHHQTQRSAAIATGGPFLQGEAMLQTFGRVVEPFGQALRRAPHFDALTLALDHALRNRALPVAIAHAPQTPRRLITLVLGRVRRQARRRRTARRALRHAHREVQAAPIKARRDVVIGILRPHARLIAFNRAHAIASAHDGFTQRLILAALFELRDSFCGVGHRGCGRGRRAQRLWRPGVFGRSRVRNVSAAHNETH